MLAKMVSRRGSRTQRKRFVYACAITQEEKMSTGDECYEKETQRKNLDYLINDKGKKTE